MTAKLCTLFIAKINKIFNNDEFLRKYFLSSNWFVIITGNLCERFFLRVIVAIWWRQSANRKKWMRCVTTAHSIYVCHDLDYNKICFVFSLCAKWFLASIKSVISIKVIETCWSANFSHSHIMYRVMLLLKLEYSVMWFKPSDMVQEEALRPEAGIVFLASLASVFTLKICGKIPNHYVNIMQNVILLAIKTSKKLFRSCNVHWLQKFPGLHFLMFFYNSEFYRKPAASSSI